MKLDIHNVVADFLKDKGFNVDSKWILVLLTLFVSFFLGALPESWNIWGAGIVGFILIVSLIWMNRSWWSNRRKDSRKQKLKEIQDAELHDALKNFESFVQKYRNLTRDEFQVLFEKKFSDNYPAYETLFKHTRVSEEQIQLLLKFGFFKSDLLDSSLFSKFIDSSRKYLNRKTWLRIQEDVNKQQISPYVRREFSYWFPYYASVPPWKSFIGFKREVFYYKIQGFLGLILALSFASAWILGSILALLNVDQSVAQQNPFYDALSFLLGFSLILLFALWVINRLIRWLIVWITQPS